MDPAYLMPKLGLRAVLVRPDGPIIDVEVSIDADGFVIEAVRALVTGEATPYALEGPTPGRGLVAWVNPDGPQNLALNRQANAAIKSLSGNATTTEAYGPVLFMARVRDTGDVAALNLEEMRAIKTALA